MCPSGLLACSHPRALNTRSGVRSRGVCIAGCLLSVGCRSESLSARPAVDPSVRQSVRLLVGRSICLFMCPWAGRTPPGLGKSFVSGLLQP